MLLRSGVDIANFPFLAPSPPPPDPRAPRAGMKVCPACMNSLSANAYFGLQACFAREQTMLAGYEDSMLCSHVRPACGHTFSRPPAVCGRTLSRRASLQGRPAAVPYPGLRPCERGLRFYLVNFYQIEKTRYRPKDLISEIRLIGGWENCQ